MEEANQAVRAVAAQAAKSGGFPLVETAFLELSEPDLASAVNRMAERGATRVLIIPYFLTLGIHLQRDLPRIISEISCIHKTMDIRVSPPLDGHPALSQIVVERAREAGC